MMKRSLQTILILLLMGKAFAQTTSLKIGDTRPEIILPMIDSGAFSLSSLKGRLVLIDFWATWCAPCVKEQPQLKVLYEKFSTAVKDGKFEIVGVSLDKDKSSWEKAVARLKINWIQVSDLKFWKSVVTNDYGIEELPFNVLVDEHNKIVAINLHGEVLEDFIQTHLSAAKPKPHSSGQQH